MTPAIQGEIKLAEAQLESNTDLGTQRAIAYALIAIAKLLAQGK